MKYLAKVSYLGLAYKGFEKQKNYPTIQGKLETALAFYLGTETPIHGAGRTDAGVSAAGQTFSFSTPKTLDLSEAIHALNRLLPSDITIKDLKEVPESFDARHSSHAKVYSYALHYGPRDPFDLTEFQMEWPNFSFEAYQACLKLYEGTHNFMNFTTKPEDKDHFIRTISPIIFEEDKEKHRFKVTLRGNGFMTYMVRIMVGVAFKVALGKLTLEDVSDLLNPSVRKIVSYKAPAEGLMLEEVIYG
jgi:tRNA pseudouridine38-40 synthase